MTVKVSYINGETYTADDLTAPMAALLSKGVHDVVGGGLLVTAQSPAALAVNVAIGKAVANGYYMVSDAITPVAITANSSGYNRIDIIVFEKGASSAASTIKAVAGTPASSPAAPVATSDQVVLAEVAVGNGVAVINAGNITDKRVIVGVKSNRKALRVSRAARAGAGAQVVTLGYRPNWVKITTRLNGGTAGHYESVGVFDGTSQMVSYVVESGTLSAFDATRIVYLHQGTGYESASIAFTDTGFTLTWDAVSTAIAVGTIEMLCEIE